MCLEQSSKLSKLELSVVKKLLEGELPPLALLRSQLDGATVSTRTLTGVGFYLTLELRPDVAPASVRAGRVVVGDVGARIPGLEHGAGFLLYIQDRKLSMLEGYSYDEAWPADTNAFELFYINDDRTEVLGGLRP